MPTRISPEAAIIGRTRRMRPSRSDAVEGLGVELDAVADVETAELGALESARRAVVEPNTDAIADDARIAAALDVVACHCAPDRAGARHDRPSGAVPELVADHGAEHAAD